MANAVHVNDVGTSFTVTITDEAGNVDLTSAMVLELWFQRPDSTVFSRPCMAVDLAGGVVQYVTQTGDLDQAGRWKMQIVVQLTNGNVKHSSVLNITIAANISID